MPYSVKAFVILLFCNFNCDIIIPVSIWDCVSKQINNRRTVCLNRKLLNIKLQEILLGMKNRLYRIWQFLLLVFNLID